MIGGTEGLSLYEAEERLRAAVLAGAKLELGDCVPDKRDGRWLVRQQIRAEAIMALLKRSQAASGGGAVLWVEGAYVVGKLDLRYSRLEMPLILQHCRFDEDIDLSEARAMLISLRGSRFPSLRGYGLMSDGDLNCTDCVSEQVDLFGGRIRGQLWLAGARVNGTGSGYAIGAPDISVDGGMYCRGLQAAGVNLFNATIGSALELDKARLSNPSGLALRAPGLIVRGDLSCTSGFSAIGSVDLFGAQIGGQLWLNGARLDKGDRDVALDAPQMRVAGGVYCNARFTSLGVVNFFGADVGSTMEFTGAHLSAPGTVCFRAPGLAVKASLTFDDGFSSSGDIDLAGCRLGELSISDAVLADGGLDLHGAEVGVLHAEPGCLPGRLRLNGFTYTALQPALPVSDRLDVLGRDQDGYLPQPYQQLADFYRSIGEDSQARTVLLIKQRLRRKQLNVTARVWGYLQDAMVGYGYRPVRALAWLLALIGLTAAYFAAFPPKSGRFHAAGFEPVIYAFHVVVPVLGIGQPNPYSGTSAAQWIIWIAQLTGWILATTVVAGMTRALSRN